MDDTQAAIGQAISASFDEWVDTTATDLLEDGTLDPSVVTGEEAVLQVMAWVSRETSGNAWLVTSRLEYGGDEEVTATVHLTWDGAVRKAWQLAKQRGGMVEIGPGQWVGGDVDEDTIDVTETTIED